MTSKKRPSFRGALKAIKQLADASHLQDRFEDEVMPVLDLVKRSGAKNLEFGWIRDGVPIWQAGWWAKATWHGAVLTVEEHVGPIEAIVALGDRVRLGASCNHCGRRIWWARSRRRGHGVPESGCVWAVVDGRWEHPHQ